METCEINHSVVLHNLKTWPGVGTSLSLFSSSTINKLNKQFLALNYSTRAHFIRIWHSPSSVLEVVMKLGAFHRREHTVRVVLVQRLIYYNALGHFFILMNHLFFYSEI